MDVKKYVASSFADVALRPPPCRCHDKLLRPLLRLYYEYFAHLRDRDRDYLGHDGDEADGYESLVSRPRVTACL